MKKVLFSIALVLVAVCASAQVKQYTHDLTPFNSIDVSNGFEVSVVSGEAFTVVLSVDEPYRDYVSCVVTGSTLYISLEEKKVPAEVKKLYKGKGVAAPTFRASVSMPEKLQNVTLHDKAVFFEAKGVMSNDVVSVSLSDNAQIKTMELSATNVNIAIDKKASANIVLDCDNLTIAAQGNANLNVEQTAKHAEYKFQGSSNVSVTGACETAVVNAEGSSKVSLVGTAATVDYNCSGSSNVNALMLVCDDANVNMTGSCNLSQAAGRNVKINLAKGATLTYAGKPAFDIENVKSSNIVRSGK